MCHLRLLPPTKTHISIKGNVAGDGEMVARLVGEISDGASGGTGVEAAAADEVEAKRNHAAAGEDEVTNGRGNISPVFNGGEIDGAGRQNIVEGSPGEAG